MNSKCLLLRTGSSSIPVHVQTVSSSHRPSVSPSVHGVSSIRRSCSIPELGLRGGGGGNGSGGTGRRNIGAYYREMIKSDSTNSLLLRNYAKYLHEGNKTGRLYMFSWRVEFIFGFHDFGPNTHNFGPVHAVFVLLLRNPLKSAALEVEGDFVKAEEYYGRAILGGPGDGEVLWLYGKLIWETQRDESRARSYFTRALQASPHDSMVLGSYAHFLWETENKK